MTAVFYVHWIFQRKDLHHCNTIIIKLFVMYLYFYIYISYISYIFFFMKYVLCALIRNLRFIPFGKTKFQIIYGKFYANEPAYVPAVFAVVFFAHTIQLLIVITTFTQCRYYCSSSPPRPPPGSRSRFASDFN